MGVGTTNPVKIEATSKAFARLWGQIDPVAVPVDASVGRQPRGYQETLRGALIRAHRARSEGDWGVGIEAGLVVLPGFPEGLDLHLSVILDEAGWLTVGQGPAFALPRTLLTAVDRGEELSQAMRQVGGRGDIGRAEGAIGLLSGRKIDRAELVEWAVMMALLPRLRSELYLRQ